MFASEKKTQMSKCHWTNKCHHLDRNVILCSYISYFITTPCFHRHVSQQIIIQLIKRNNQDCDCRRCETFPYQDSTFLPGGFAAAVSIRCCYVSHIHVCPEQHVRSLSLFLSPSLSLLYNCSVQTAKILKPTVLKIYTVYIYI